MEALTPEDWRAWEYRQKTFDRIHGKTQTVPFRWLRGDWKYGQPLHCVDWDWHPALFEAIQEQVSWLEDLMQGRAVNIILAKLPAGETIGKHRDFGFLLEAVHRCHLPILTCEEVAFNIEGTDHFWPAGVWHELDNQTLHAVYNRSAIDRVHLMADILPRRFL